MNTCVSADQILWTLTHTTWSQPYPLNRNERIAAQAWHHDALPNQPGVYGVYAGETLAYIGQSGDLRQRINALGVNVSREQMPFTTPHVAAPALWLLARLQDSLPLTVSFARFASSAYWRQGVEDVAIALQRWRHKRHPVRSEGWPSSYSPLANYGRFRLGWRPSTSQALGERGGPSSLSGPWHLPDIAPYDELDDQRDAFAEVWGGHVWSAWQDAHTVVLPSDWRGLYRLWRPGVADLWFLGSGKLASAAHKAASLAGEVVFSAVSGEWTARQMEELKADLLGLYACQRQSFPVGQYGGKENAAAGNAWPQRVQEGDQEWQEASPSWRKERSFS